MTNSGSSFEAEFLGRVRIAAAERDEELSKLADQEAALLAARDAEEKPRLHQAENAARLRTAEIQATKKKAGEIFSILPQVAAGASKQNLAPDVVCSVLHKEGEFVKKKGILGISRTVWVDYEPLAEPLKLWKLGLGRQEVVTTKNVPNPLYESTYDYYHRPQYGVSEIPQYLKEQVYAWRGFALSAEGVLYDYMDGTEESSPKVSKLEQRAFLYSDNISLLETELIRFAVANKLENSLAQ